MIMLKIKQNNGMEEMIANIGGKYSVIEYGKNYNVNIAIESGNETCYVYPEKKNSKNYLTLEIKNNQNDR